MAVGQKRLFLVDGMPLIFRAYFVFLKNPRITSRGQNVSAIYGYANSLLQILEKEKPTHMAVVFDTPKPTQRHVEYPAYKAQREAIPEDLGSAIPHVFKITEALNIPAISMEGFEADDIIGTFSVRAQREGYQTFMVTPDKDYSQLVDEDVFLYRPGRMGEEVEILGVPEVLKKWGIERIEQVTDILGLAGDAVDNIPGIPGIGEKTAQKLIAQYGSVENLLQCCRELKGKLKENVQAFGAQGLLSKRLATIIRDVPINFDLARFERVQPDRERLSSLLAEYEMTALAKRIFGKSFDPAAPLDLFSVPAGAPGAEPGMLQELVSGLDEAGQPGVGELPEAPPKVELKTIRDFAPDYRLVQTPEERAALLRALQNCKSFCFDSETTGLNPRTASLVGLSFCMEAHKAYYVPVPGDREQALALLAEFRAVFADAEIEKVGHNLKFDIAMLNGYGLRVGGRLFDTMLAHSLIAPDMRHGMDYLSEHYLQYTPIPITDLIGPEGQEQLSMRDVPVEKAAEYAAEDADVTWQLRQVLEPSLKEMNCVRVFHEAECPLIPVLVSMESEGVTLDTAGLKVFSEELSLDIEELETRIYEAAGCRFNLNSPRQMGEVFFDKLKLEAKAKKTKTGQYATNEEVLNRLAVKHDIARQVLDFRNAMKLKTTYVDMLPGAVFRPTGRIHTTYNQLVTATGRMQSHGPNLQNIPIRTEKGKEIRRAFVSRGDEHLLLSADYSQIELRVFAELSRDPALIEAFVQGEDIHRATAAKVFAVPPDEVTAEMRRRAKMVNFGIIYGISAFGLSQRLNIPRGEAFEIIEQYFAKYPGIKRYMDETINSARENGYVETIIGRRRYLRDINSQNATARGAAERNAINTPIQGSAADMIKIAMVNIHRRLSDAGLETKMILQVHDELVFDMRIKERELVIQIVENAMKTALPLQVPLVVDMGVGRTWLAAH